MICSHCYTKCQEKYDMGKLFNNSKGLVFACSKACSKALINLVKTGEWLTYKPDAIFNNNNSNPSPSFEKNI